MAMDNAEVDFHFFFLETTLFKFGFFFFASFDACLEACARIAPADFIEYPSLDIFFCTALKPGCFFISILHSFWPKNHGIAELIALPLSSFDLIDQTTGLRFAQAA